jgi:hypothetical protein
MPDPVTATVGAISGGATIYGSRQAKKGAEAAAEAQVQGAELGILEQRAAREALEERLQPFVEFGKSGGTLLGGLLGVGTPKLQQEEFDRLKTIPGLPQALDPSTLPGSMDLGQLPAAGTAFGPESFKDNPMLDFVLKEGFRGIREKAAGGGRVPDRDLVEFAQGTASTLLPALQAQQFGQQQALRGQSLAEQQAIRSQALGEQAQRFGQLGGLRESAIGEQQRSINNLLGLLGMSQSAAAGQGAAGLSTGANISNLLGNIGTAQAQGALGAAQARQGMAGNIAGLAGLLGGAIGGQPYQRPMYPTGGAQVGPFDAYGRF